MTWAVKKFSFITFFILIHILSLLPQIIATIQQFQFFKNLKIMLMVMIEIHIFLVWKNIQQTFMACNHILYFTNKKLDYFKVHEKMPLHTDINIQLVPKTKRDIKKVISYMLKNQII